MPNSSIDYSGNRDDPLSNDDQCKEAHTGIQMGVLESNRRSLGGRPEYLNSFGPKRRPQAYPDVQSVGIWSLIEHKVDLPLVSHILLVAKGMSTHSTVRDSHP